MMKKNYQLSIFMMIALFNWNFIISGQSQVIDTILPLDTNHWANMDCGQLTQMNDTLRIFAYDYRIGLDVYYNDFFNFQNNGEAYFKFKFNSENDWLATLARIDGISTQQLTGNYQEDTWYYIHIKINSSDFSADFTSATGNYDDAGGNVIENYHYNIGQTDWNLIASTKLNLKLWDNYGGDLCYMDIGEVRLKNVIPVNLDATIVNDQTYDFEDGLIPSVLVTSDNDWQVDTTTGYNSSNALYVNCPPNESRNISMDLPANTVKVEFDVLFKSNTHKPAWVFFDSNKTNISFEKSATGCWKHVEWQYNFHEPHHIGWNIGATQVPGVSNAELWIDNIKISYDNYTEINSENSHKQYIYPNPANDYILIDSEINTYIIRDLTGKNIQFGKPSGNEPVDISQLSQGIYLIELKQKEKTKIIKLLKK
jgi:hypothetical protein